MRINKNKTVTFTGYRSQEIQHLTEDKNLVNVITTEVYRTVKLFYEQGYNTFLTGGSEGFATQACKYRYSISNGRPLYRTGTAIQRR